VAFGGVSRWVVDGARFAGRWAAFGHGVGVGWLTVRDCADNGIGVIAAERIRWHDP